MRGSEHGGGCDVKKMKMELRESLLEEREKVKVSERSDVRYI